MGNTVDLHHQLLDRAEALEPMPDVVVKLAMAVNNPESGTEDLAGILGTDPALAAHVLREANSASSAARSPIGTLDAAIARLGGGRILELALRYQVADQLDQPLPGYCSKAGEMRQHAIAVSAAAELTRRAARVPVSPDVVSAGLLHDLGKCVIDPFLRSDIVTAFRLAGASQDELEFEAVEVTHAEVGAFIVESWRLPATMADAIRFHHDPGYCAEAAVLLVAEHIAHGLLPDQAAIESRDDAAYAGAIDLLGLADGLVQLTEAVRARFVDAGMLPETN
ncbi:MAG: HDOD domain-containing protein [Acidimicrobiales bacterium]|nr:HDOD domain-containing protein [Acidimicrobiales bacterium]